MFDLRPEELVKIRVRAEAATPGPWFYGSDDAGYGEAIYPASESGELVSERRDIMFPLGYGDAGLAFLNVADGRFIAAARMDVPLLCSAVAQRDVRIAELEERLAEATRRAREAERSRP